MLFQLEPPDLSLKQVNLPFQVKLIVDGLRLQPFGEVLPSFLEVFEVVLHGRQQLLIVPYFLFQRLHILALLHFRTSDGFLLVGQLRGELGLNDLEGS